MRPRRARARRPDRAALSAWSLAACSLAACSFSACSLSAPLLEQLLPGDARQRDGQPHFVGPRLDGLVRGVAHRIGGAQARAGRDCWSSAQPGISSPARIWLRIACRWMPKASARRKRGSAKQEVGQVLVGGLVDRLAEARVMEHRAAEVRHQAVHQRHARRARRSAANCGRSEPTIQGLMRSSTWMSPRFSACIAWITVAKRRSTISMGRPGASVKYCRLPLKTVSSARSIQHHRAVGGRGIGFRFGVLQQRHLQQGLRTDVGPVQRRLHAVQPGGRHQAEQVGPLGTSTGCCRGSPSLTAAGPRRRRSGVRCRWPSGRPAATGSTVCG